MRLRLVEERLDHDDGSPAEVRAGLADLWWFNGIGGLKGWERLLQLALPPEGKARRLTLLDVGAGTGEMTAALAGLLAARGLAVTAIRLDRRATHLSTGAATPAVVADAMRLPFADASIDWVTTNLFLHHFHDRPGDPAATALLQSLFRVARCGVLISDLERAWPAYFFARVIVRWLPWVGGRRLSPITLHDAPASVGQSYTLSELRQLVGRALPPGAQVFRLPGYRLGLVAPRSAGRAERAAP